jgi:hypothetical protein
MTDYIGEKTKQKGRIDYSYAYYKSRDPAADETPTQGGYRNNFGTHLAAQIRGAQQHVDSLYAETDVIYVFSVGGCCADVRLKYGGTPPDTSAFLDFVLHYTAKRRTSTDGSRG